MTRTCTCNERGHVAYAQKRGPRHDGKQGRMQHHPLPMKWCTTCDAPIGFALVLPADVKPDARVVDERLTRAILVQRSAERGEVLDVATLERRYHMGRRAASQAIKDAAALAAGQELAPWRKA